MSTKTINYADQVLEDLVASVIDAIEADPGHWTQPWAKSILTSGMPTNTNGYGYTGGNFLLALGAQLANGFTTAVWGTKRQWEEALGAERVIKKGSSKTYFLRPQVIKVTKDADGNPLAKKDCYAFTRFKVFGAFNADQIEGGAEWAAEHFGSGRTVRPLAHAEEWMAKTGAIILTGTAAFYSPMADSITLPPRDEFVDAISYYSTAAHELGHWTGHRSRLNRAGVTMAANEKTLADYAFEELVAELTSVIVGATQLDLVIDPRPENAAYLDHWVRQLRETPKVLWRAAGHAFKAASFLADLQGEA